MISLISTSTRYQLQPPAASTAIQARLICRAADDTGSTDRWKADKTLGLALGVIVSVLTVLISCLYCFLRDRERKRKRRAAQEQEERDAREQRLQQELGDWAEYSAEQLETERQERQQLARDAAAVGIDLSEITRILSSPTQSTQPPTYAADDEAPPPPSYGQHRRDKRLLKGPRGE